MQAAPAMPTQPTHPTQEQSAAATTVYRSLNQQQQQQANIKPSSNSLAQEPAQDMPQAAVQPPAPHRSDNLPLGDYSLDFLLPAGSTWCQLDTILLTALASYKLEEEMVSSMLGIAGLADLHRVATALHSDHTPMQG